MKSANIQRVALALLVSAISFRAAEIPLIDLAGEKHRQVVVDREPGQYLGHPTTVLLEDGQTIIAVYPKGHGRGAIVMKRSDDRGMIWSSRLPVPENWATSKETPTIYRVIDPEGKKRLILFSGLYPIRVSVSGLRIPAVNCHQSSEICPLKTGLPPAPE